MGIKEIGSLNDLPVAFRSYKVNGVGVYGDLLALLVSAEEWMISLFTELYHRAHKSC